jgi:hypothetical protein
MSDYARSVMDRGQDGSLLVGHLRLDAPGGQGEEVAALLVIAEVERQRHEVLLAVLATSFW